MALGLTLGLVLGVLAGTHLHGEVSPADELTQWVDAGFSEEEARILVTYGRANLVPADIRRLAQSGSPGGAELEQPSAGRPPAPAQQRARPAPAPSPQRPRQTRPADAEARRRLQHACQELQAGNHTTAEAWLQAMRAQGNPWRDLAERVRTEVPPEQQPAAAADAWRRLCTRPAPR